jgi:acetyl esterase
MIHCGYFHVSDAERYDGKVSTIVAGRLRMIRKNYLPQSLRDTTREHWGLADPLVILEKRAPAQMHQIRAFPEVFIPVGDRDPVMEDSLRLDRALKALGVRSASKVYLNSPHALYAMPWHAQYQACWGDIRNFLGKLV